MIQAVYDCNIFAQALLSPQGPAASCVRSAASGTVRLYISSAIIAEIQELPEKLPPNRGVTQFMVDALIDRIRTFAVLVDDVPVVYMHPDDPDDSIYVNLALATGAMLVVSRDQHLLNLMDTTRPEGRAFQAQFCVRIVEPVSFLRELDAGSTNQAEVT